MYIVKSVTRSKLREWARSLIMNSVDCWAADNLHESLPSMTDGEVWDVDALSEKEFEQLLDLVRREIKGANVEVFWDD